MNNTLFISGAICGISGYDNLVHNVIRQLLRFGMDIRLNSACPLNSYIVPDLRKLQTVVPAGAWELIITPPLSLPKLHPNCAVFTMWECDRLEPSWVEQLNQAGLVIVPSQWQVDNFVESGVTIPIHKVPLGYDPQIFNVQGSFPTECVFGTAAALTAGGIRKNTARLVKSFGKAFPNNEPVKLKVKITPACPWREVDDPRVEVLKKFLKPPDLANWYRSLTAFVNASSAEGFGLHNIEALGCQRPLISSDYSAVSEYFDEQVGWPVKYELLIAYGGSYTGVWSRLIEESLIEQMRYVYTHQEEARAKGEKAALRAKDYTWDAMGEKLFSLLGSSPNSY